MMVQLELFLDPLSPPPTPSTKKKTTKKTIQFGPPLTKLSGSAHVYMGLCQLAHDYLKLAALILCNNEEYLRTFEY